MVSELHEIRDVDLKGIKSDIGNLNLQFTVGVRQERARETGLNTCHRNISQLATGDSDVGKTYSNRLCFIDNLNASNVISGKEIDYGVFFT